ncbi:DNA alkylation repair protein [Candidatus Leptofilum sp.]|uniref:DNA alkylation repair protein n=1 Tax=Candidatus Leptofilum sp. TaxID=3241576 RepID=UPI003B5C96C9
MTLQKTITRKRDLAPILADVQAVYMSGGAATVANWLRNHLLCHRVKFPLLEHTAVQLATFIPQPEQQTLINNLVGLPEHGSSVIIGKLLQLWLPHSLPEAFQLAEIAITKGDAWYHCDHIGERVFGYALRHQFEEALPLLTHLLQDGNDWLQRAVGVAAHYATKKGLPAAEVETVLALLMTQVHSSAYEVQRGVGWGLKTIAKFHPDLMQRELAKLPPGAIAAPIRRKIETGLATAAKKRVSVG